MRVENWNGYDIRFVEINGEWYAILKDICDALKLRTAAIAQRLDADMLERVLVEAPDDLTTFEMTLDTYEPIKKLTTDMLDRDIRRRPGQNKTRWMLAVNEIGIYEALYASRKLEARKFRRWSAGVMKKLRGFVGLEGYEAMRLTEKDIQDKIDDILDVLYWDDEKKCLMVSITVQGGDADQITFDEYLRDYRRSED